jgi:DNA modification methylase
MQELGSKLNKIIQMDCLEYLKSLPDECTECVLIDEPYMLLKGHKIEEGYNLDIAKQVRIEAMRVLKQDGWFIFFGQFPSAWDFGRITMEVRFKPWQMCNEIVWCKRILSSPFQKLARIHENIFVFQKGKPQTYANKAPFEDITVDNAFHGIANFETIKRYIAFLKSGKEKPQILETSNKNDEFYNFDKNNIPRSKGRFEENINLPSIWSFCKENQMHRSNHNITHPTVKPTLLFRRLIKLFTQQGDTILDCFSGSGTTALASIQEGRNFLCCERDEGYIKIANDRLANWKEDLERQDKWLNERGVMDFESDVKHKVSYQENTLL